jgi:hypothetical protein
VEKKRLQWIAAAGVSRTLSVASMNILSENTSVRLPGKGSSGLYLSSFLRAGRDDSREKDSGDKGEKSALYPECSHKPDEIAASDVKEL